MDNIDRLIDCIAKDIIGGQENRQGAMEDCLAVNCEPDRRLLALLVAYQLGEQLADKVCGDVNNP